MSGIKKILLLVVLWTIILCACTDNRNDLEPETGNVAAATGSSRLAGLLGNNDASGFPQVLEERAFRFPADHGPHAEFRNEWWYVTGNLDSDDGQRFGFELTFFRFALVPERLTSNDSAWATNQVFVAHFAVSDASTEKFYVAQRYSRGAADLAGASAQPFRIWLDDWVMEATDDDAGRWSIRANHDGIAMSLNLEPRKVPVLNGDNGLSQKSGEPGNASYYYSVTRLQTDGVLQIEDQSYSVSGLSWLDREWGSSALSNDQVGWDWFALQLSDGTDLMFYNLRKSDGSTDSHSAGTLTMADGGHQRLASTDVEISVLDYWENGRGDRYPIAWTMQIPGRHIELNIKPVFKSQELVATVRYWEGAVDVSGKDADGAVEGRGYVELTGYAR